MLFGNHRPPRLIVALRATLACSTLTVIACSEKSFAPAVSRVSDTALLQDTAFVITPVGELPRACVHEIPAGAVVSRDRVVSLPDGRSFKLPVCDTPPVRSSGPLLAPTVNQYLEYVFAPVDTVNQWNHSFETIWAKWVVPNAPANSYSSGKVYYTFPGLEPGAANLIVQPVLQYGNNRGFGGNYWSIASWVCSKGAPGYTCTHSVPRTVSTGDTIIGWAYPQSCVGSSCTWVVNTKSVAQNFTTTLYSGAPQRMWYAFGGAVEVYNLTSCSDFPASGVYYSEVVVQDYQGVHSVVPNWEPYLQSNVSPWCSYGVSWTTGEVSTVTLRHN